MADKKKNNYNNKKNDNKKIKEKKKTYGNPVNTVWGKIIIFVLAFAMCFGGLFGLIMAIINNL